MTDLELISTNDLIEELKNRSECLVIAHNTPDKIDNSKQTINYAYRGDWLTCLGLLDYAREELIKYNQREDEED